MVQFDTFPCIRIAQEKTADPTNFRLLCQRRERPCDCGAAEKSDEGASSHVRTKRLRTRQLQAEE
jgi:hypothetical protein